MASIYTQKNSPYYWIRYYDILEHDPSKKRKSLNSKIPITPADQRRIEEAKRKGEKPELQGTPELKKRLREFKTGLAERNMQAKSGVKLIKKLKLSEGFQEFKDIKSIPGSKKEVKKKTLSSYALAVDHMIQCCGDKYIYRYSENDYVKLLYYFEERKIKGKAIKDKKGKVVDYEYKPMSKNSRAIYTRSLHAIWAYFVEKYYTNQNIIEVINPEYKDPDPIDHEDMFVIIEYLKQDNSYPHHYWIIYYMLLTGCRPSSAIMQMKEDIDFKNKVIKIPNVKSGGKKNKPFYKFPLYKELERLLKEIGVKEGSTGRLFDMYTVVPDNYTWPLSFWERKINLLVKAKSIKKRYLIKQIRPTFISFLINVLKMDIYTVYKLADHANIKTTDTHYINHNVNKIRKELDDVKLESFLDDEQE